MAGNIVREEIQQSPAFEILRQDLTIYPAEPDKDGSPAWILHDPLSNRHYHLGKREVELLTLIAEGESSLARVEPEKREAVEEELRELFAFLRQNNLVVARSSQRTWFLRQKMLMRSSGWLAKLAKSYLFFRIPVWSPDRFLDRTIRYVSWLGQKKVYYGLAVLLFLGAFMALRQADTFITTFLHFFSFQGFVAYLLTLFFVKIVHELGHAYVAKAMGCKVPIIGVAFLVGWPVLYTDTSDAWKLASRVKRMKIGIAGVGVETGIAIIALFLWGLTPEGMLKSIFFILATTTWAMSVLINFNPLMRFDGYYLLSDFLRVPNLEQRSTAMAKWWLREKLFGIGLEEPEPVKKGLVVYAFSIWIYRFFLFLGIALLVYYFFFKLLGIVLFFVEIIYFIGAPIYREVSAWWNLRDKMRWNRNTIVSAGAAVSLAILGLLPWSNSYRAPAQIEMQYTQLYFPLSGQIKAFHVKNGQPVSAGELLMELSVPDLAHEISQLKRRYSELSWSRQSLGFNRKLKQQAMVVESELVTQNQRLRGKVSDEKKSTVLAPHSGIVVNVVEDLATGDWVPEGEPVFAIIDRDRPHATAYVSEQDVGRLKVGAAGRFYPENANWGPVRIRIFDIEAAGIRYLDSLYPASTHGGNLAVRETGEKGLVPVTATYKVRLKIEGKSNLPNHVIRGTALINGERESLVGKVGRQLMAIYHRESGF